MHDVVMLVLGAVQQVSNDASVFRDPDFGGTFHCPHRGQTMNVRSDPARALHEMVSVPGIPSLQDDFDPPEHLAGTPGVDNLATRYLNLDAKVAFYSGNRVDYNSLGHMFSSRLRLLSLKCG
jgi:hypothetical protein